MYVVVEIKLGGKIVWSDSKNCTSKRQANERKALIERMQPKREFTIIKFTKYQLAA